MDRYQKITLFNTVLTAAMALANAYALIWLRGGLGNVATGLFAASVSIYCGRRFVLSRRGTD